MSEETTLLRPPNPDTDRPLLWCVESETTGQPISVIRYETQEEAKQAHLEADPPTRVAIAPECVPGPNFNTGYRKEPGYTLWWVRDENGERHISIQVGDGTPRYFLPEELEELANSIIPRDSILHKRLKFAQAIFEQEAYRRSMEHQAQEDHERVQQLFREAYPGLYPEEEVEVSDTPETTPIVTNEGVIGYNLPTDALVGDTLVVNGKKHTLQWVTEDVAGEEE